MWVFIGMLVLVIALGAGPVMWIRPSPRQKQIAEYRQRAAKLGLRIKLASLKSLGISQDLPTVKDGLPLYGIAWDLSRDDEKQFSKELANSSWCLKRGSYEHDGHFMGFWDWASSKKAKVDTHGALREFLGVLPGDVVACECTGQGVSLGWLEKGKVTRVDELAELLQQFRKACLPRQ